LARPPYRLRPWEVARLTDHQLVNVYLRPRTEEGELIREAAPQEGGAGPLETACKQLWTEQGETPEQVEQHWQRYCQQHKIPVPDAR
jgi:hypothetical protein